MKDPVFQALAEAAVKGEPVVLGVISGAKGSSPQKVGAKAVFHADGRITGTLGGGCLEAEVQRRALEALRTGKPSAFDLVLDHDFGWDDGLICGGKVEGLILPDAQLTGADLWSKLARREVPLAWGVQGDFSIRCMAQPLENAEGGPGPVRGEAGSWLFSERVAPPCALWIAGAGHIAQAVAPLAQQLDFEVTVLDDRPALASPRFFPEGVRLKADAWEHLLESPLTQAPSFALIVTRGHRHDALVLRHWIQKPFVFLGMIGSARKARMIFEHFLDERLATAEDLKRVTCPVGLNIGSQTVPEIALSIVAQCVQKRAELGASH